MAVTLADLDSLPHVRPMDLGSTNCGDFAINCKEYRAEAGMVRPEEEALEFYALNHLVAIAKAKHTKNEPLPSWAAAAVTRYSEVLASQGIRLVYYTTLISTRESRHVHSQESLLKEATNQFDAPCTEFNKSIHGAGSSGAVERFLSYPPETTIGKFIGSLRFLFFEGKFSGGYGGKPWGMIAQTMEHFFIGKTSLEVMIDTAYTLAHNNGPMFNKGMMYEHYTNDIYRILDVQRSGQMLELIINGESETFVKKETRNLVKACKEAHPTAFGDYVDWQKVEDLGALKKYPKEKAKQFEKYPKVEKTSGGLDVVGKFDVMPGKSALIYKRPQAA